MKSSTKSLLGEYKKQFTMNYKFLDNNNWNEHFGAKKEFELSEQIIFTMINTYKSFIDTIGLERYEKQVIKFTDDFSTKVGEHLEKIDAYLDNNERVEKRNRRIEELSEIPVKTKKEKEEYNRLVGELTDEVEFSNYLFSSKVKTKNKLSAINVSVSGVETSPHIFFSDEKGSLIMRPLLTKEVDYVEKRTSSLDLDFSVPHMNLSTSNEMLVNMKKKDIPPYDPSVHFFEQEKSTIQFWEEEFQKCKNGIVVGGYHIHPFLYWHLNIFKFTTGSGENKGVTNPIFWDNDFYFGEMLKLAEQDGKKGILSYGTRRSSKSTKMASYADWRMFTVPHANGILVSFDKESIDSILEYGRVNKMYLPGAFKVETLTNSIENGINLGLRKMNGVDRHLFASCKISVATTNVKGGMLKTAGGTPDFFIGDEVAKGDIITVWDTARASFTAADSDKWRTVPLMSACVCKGTKVWTKEGKQVNVEDITKETGILGYNGSEMSKEEVTWLQPPTQKQCVELHLPYKQNLRCSFDHPLMVIEKDRVLFRKASDIKKGDTVAFYKENKKKYLFKKILRGKGDFFLGKHCTNITPVKVKEVEDIGLQDVYNLTASNTHTYITNGLISHNTAGDENLSKSVEKMLQNPAEYNILPMDWDLYDDFIPKEHQTWEKETFSFFVPAQMSLEAPRKKKTNLGSFLEMPGHLSNIEMEVTDWEKATPYFKEKQESLKHIPEQLAAEQKNFPLSVADCLVSVEHNRFPSLVAKRHKKYIEENQLTGRKVWFDKLPDGTITAKTTNDPIITEYPYKGGNFDAPVVLLDELDEFFTPNFALYVIGLDDIKHKTTSGDSVFSVTMYKRAYDGGQWGDRFCGYYHTRPYRKEDAYKQTYLLMKRYNAIVFPENDDEGFIEYIERYYPEDLRHIATGVDFARLNNIFRNSNREYGFSTSAASVEYINRRLEYYTKREDMVINGETGLLGIQSIYDPMLLEEFARYKPGKNADRIRSAALAYAYGDFLDKYNMHVYMSKDPYQRMMEERKNRKQEEVELDAFGDMSDLEIW